MASAAPGCFSRPGLNRRVAPLVRGTFFVIFFDPHSRLSTERSYPNRLLHFSP